MGMAMAMDNMRIDNELLILLFWFFKISRKTRLPEFTIFIAPFIINSKLLFIDFVQLFVSS